MWKKKPTAVPNRMPMISAPFTRWATRTAVRSNPISAVFVTGSDRCPGATGGAPGPPGMTIRAFTRPMKAMNRPMPAPMARRRSRGMACMIASRRPAKTSNVVRTPSRTINPIAACHDPACGATVKATIAFSPIPLASARGKLAKTPMRMQQMPAASAVEARKVPESCGVAPVAFVRMSGLTKRMYAIVRNVAKAPRSSRPTVLPRARRWKNRSSGSDMSRFRGTSCQPVLSFREKPWAGNPCRDDQKRWQQTPHPAQAQQQPEIAAAAVAGDVTVLGQADEGFGDRIVPPRRAEEVGFPLHAHGGHGQHGGDGDDDQRDRNPRKAAIARRRERHDEW